MHRPALPRPRPCPPAPRRGVAALASLVALGLACAGSSAPRGSAPDCRHMADGFGPAGAAPVVAETFVSGLEVPWGLAFLPDGSLLVAERPGRLRLVTKEGRLVAEPVLSLAVHSQSEEGLLGLALHLQFPENRLFYLYWTRAGDPDPTNRVERFRLAADGRSATKDRDILEDIPAARFHSGGFLRFGPDGMLYVGTGDARHPEWSQDRGTLAGKVLRVTPDGGVPPDNPFPGSPVWVLGVRNVEGFDWRPDGTLLLVDHGPSGELGRRGGDEVHVAERGANLGWPTVWGCEAKEGLQAPALVWEEAVPPGGATWYEGDAIPAWKGSLLVGTLGSRHLHRVVFAPDAPRRVHAHEVYFRGDPPAGHGRLRGMLTGPDGALYVATSNCDGRGTCPPDKDRILRVTQRRGE